MQEYQRVYGGDWSQGCKVIEKGNAEGRPTIYQTSHWAVLGGEGLAKVEAHFGVQLPDSAHAFYTEIRECVLSLSEVIMVLTPEQIIAHEDEHRAIYKDIGLDLPVTIIRFASFPGQPLDYAFRKSCTDGLWRITLIASAEDEPESDHSIEADGLETDENIDAWMERLLRTDAYPLRPGHEEWEKRYATRIN